MSGRFTYYHVIGDFNKTTMPKQIAKKTNKPTAKSAVRKNCILDRKSQTDKDGYKKINS
jgi:hypothetical protein